METTQPQQRPPTGEQRIVEPNGIANEGTGYREPPLSMIDAAIERRLALNRERVQAALHAPQPSPSPAPDLTAGLWSLVPKNQRPLVVLVLLLFSAGSGSWLVNLGAIWGIPAEMTSVKDQLKIQGEQLKEIKDLLMAPASRPK